MGGAEMIDKLKFEQEWGMLVERMGHASDCTECNKCEEICTQHLDIIARLAEVAEWSKDPGGTFKLCDSKKRSYLPYP